MQKKEIIWPFIKSYTFAILFVSAITSCWYLIEFLLTPETCQYSGEVELIKVLGALIICITIVTLVPLISVLVWAYIPEKIQEKIDRKTLNILTVIFKPFELISEKVSRILGRVFSKYPKTTSRIVEILEFLGIKIFLILLVVLPIVMLCLITIHFYEIANCLK